jgi:hypothetical protein
MMRMVMTSVFAAPYRGRNGRATPRINLDLTAAETRAIRAVESWQVDLRENVGPGLNQPKCE